MKRVALTGVLLCCTLPATADMPPPDISSYLSPGKNDFGGLSETEWQMFNDAGHTVGFQGGKAQRAHELRNGLLNRDELLNRLYDFRPLISKQGYLPPVIVTAKDIAHVKPEQIRTAHRTYTILLPARFVSNPPTWRAYLLLGLNNQRADAPDISVHPKNSKERAVWQQAVRRGWEEGRQSADRTLESNMNRLTRDYAGMLRYSTLLQQGMIHSPEISETQQTVTGSANDLMLGDKTRRIEKPGGFILDKKSWKPSVRKEQK